MSEKGFCVFQCAACDGRGFVVSNSGECDCPHCGGIGSIAPEDATAEMVKQVNEDEMRKRGL